MRINQFHSGTALGDAITNQMLDIQRVLRSAGYESEIYAEHIAEPLKDKISDIKKYKGDTQGILLIHHSMGFDLFDKIILFPDKKVIIYHNITPEKFFNDSGTRKYIRLGLKQIKDYKKYVDYAVADSNYNRRQMIEMGYSNVDVMPVQISLDRFQNVRSDRAIKERFKNSKNILFVGRVVPNKCQDDLIKAFAIYQKQFEQNSNLLLAGDLGYFPYVEELKNLCKELGVENRVHFLGKITESELKASYESANLFLCMSEHEGFGVPLLEAMKAQIPVIAYDSSAISETMSGAGILLSEKNYALIAGLIDEVITNQDLSNGIIRVQNRRIDKLEKTKTDDILLKVIENVIKGKRLRKIQMQGPFETSYSLAIVNRKLIEAIDDLGMDDASIYCTEGPGDYEPDKKNLIDKPHAKKLWEKSKSVTYPDIVIRNMYPPRVSDSNGGLNFGAFGWEESRIPEQFIKSFNRYLDGIGTMSNFVTEVLRDNDITIPVRTMGIGVELPSNYKELSKFQLNTHKKNIFLHISSAFPRKGVDILLKAYCQAFTASDDVCLVIKTFPNPHNSNLEREIENLRKNKENPEIELINKDLSTDRLYGLYKSATCYVHVARGEGFGLPVAEAMLAKVPVIVSPNTGMADFCTEETAILVDYVMSEANTHLSITGSMWAEPNADMLTKQMYKFIYSPEEFDVERKVQNAYQLISTQYTWKAVAERWENFISEVTQMKNKCGVDMVTTWNTKCGIAEYTKLQCEAMRNYTNFQIYPNYGVLLLNEDEDNVSPRVWHSAFEGNLDELTEVLENSTNDIVHIQFNYGFFKLCELSKMIEKLCKKKKIIITFHKTKAAEVLGKIISLKEITDSLNKCFCLVVHQKEDADILEGYGIDPALIRLIPLGQCVYEPRKAKDIKEKLGISDRIVLGSYGFLLPHKGILENIEAVRRLKTKYSNILYLVCCSLHDSKESREYYKKCLNAVKKWGLQNNVIFITEYLPNDEAMVILQSCDVLLMTYLPTDESASGAIRFCIAARRPIIVTKQPIFEEYFECTVQVKIGNVQEICEKVEMCLEKDADNIEEKIEQKIRMTSWENVAMEWKMLYEEAYK